MIDTVFASPWLFTLVMVIMMAASLKLTDLFFTHLGPKLRHMSGIHRGILSGTIKAFIAVFFILTIGKQFSIVQQFYSSILMSSSLIVVVLGFILQEGLSNIVHGLIISIFKPFDIGDRIHIVTDGQQITGHVESITLRNTVIRNVLNSSRVIVPNTKIDLSVIENMRAQESRESTSFVDLTISYDSDLQLACRIFSEQVCRHPLFTHRNDNKTPAEMAPVYIRDLGPNGISLRVTVFTRTIDDNFSACSDIRRSVAKRFQSEPDVSFASARVVLTDQAH